MDFSATHEFAAPAAEVGTLMVDPSFEANVALPDLAPPEVLEHRAGEGEHVLRLRYEFVGHLDPIAKRVVGNRKLLFIQEVRLDPAAGRGALRLFVEAEPNKVQGQAVIELAVAGAAQCVRRMRGTFKVGIPLIGGTAERALLPGVLRRFDVEADALRARLAETRP
jgi:hypothetical protein